MKEYFFITYQSNLPNGVELSQRVIDEHPLTFIYDKHINYRGYVGDGDIFVILQSMPITEEQYNKYKISF